MAAPDPAGGGEGVAAGDPRVHLANERTYLAWARTALGTFALAVAVGRVVPELGHDRSRWTYQVIGSAWALFGLLLAGYGFLRHQAVDTAIRRGGDVAPRKWHLLLVTGCITVLGVSSFVILTVK